jgi:chromate transporter
VAGALRGMGAVAAGLIIATGLKLIGALSKNRWGAGLPALARPGCFAAIALLQLPLPGCCWAARLLACVLPGGRLA